jgi:hypothetical protein
MEDVLRLQAEVAETDTYTCTVITSSSHGSSCL